MYIYKCHKPTRQLIGPRSLREPYKATAKKQLLNKLIEYEQYTPLDILIIYTIEICLSTDPDYDSPAYVINQIQASRYEEDIEISSTNTKASNSLTLVMSADELKKTTQHEPPQNLQ